MTFPGRRENEIYARDRVASFLLLANREFRREMKSRLGNLFGNFVISNTLTLAEAPNKRRQASKEWNYFATLTHPKSNNISIAQHIIIIMWVRNHKT